jgi:predicted nucleotidyltransferase
MKTKSIKEKIKEYFFLNPTKKLRVRQIEKTLQVPLPSAIRYVKELINEEILKLEEVSNIKFYTSKRESKFIQQKQLFNIQKIYDSNLIEYLIDSYSNPQIILFGSYAKGEDLENSDIDLYIETLSKKRIDLKKFEKILNRKIELFIHPRINKISNKLLANNILNGINLNGFIEVFK